MSQRSLLQGQHLVHYRVQLAAACGGEQPCRSRRAGPARARWLPSADARVAASRRFAALAIQAFGASPDAIPLPPAARPALAAPPGRD